MCVDVGNTHTMEHVWLSKDNFWVWVLTFHHAEAGLLVKVFTASLSVSFRNSLLSRLPSWHRQVGLQKLAPDLGSELRYSRFHSQGLYPLSHLPAQCISFLFRVWSSWINQ